MFVGLREYAIHSTQAPSRPGIQIRAGMADMLFITATDAKWLRLNSSYKPFYNCCLLYLIRNRS